jgi:hypothetical protein
MNTYRIGARKLALPLVLTALLSSAALAAGDKTKTTTTGSANTANASASTGATASTNTNLIGNVSDADFGTIYGMMDANGDGTISRAEYMNYHSARYDRFDTAKRGSLDRQTIRSAMFEREMRKTDGNTQGTKQAASPGTTITR